MYYVVSPLNTNYRAGDWGGDWTIERGPEADYYESEAAAIEAAQAINVKVLEEHAKSMAVYGPPTEQNNQDVLAEQGAFVVEIVWDPVERKV